MLMLTSLPFFFLNPCLDSHIPLMCMMFTLHSYNRRSGLWYNNVYTHSPNQDGTMSTDMSDRNAEN